MSTNAQVQDALAWFRRQGTDRGRKDLLRYGIQAPRAFGVSVSKIQLLAKQLGRDHDLALALWDTRWYDARMLAAFVGEPEKVTAGQMDRWARDFDNWAICDTVCFHLFDRSPLAWRKVGAWSRRRDEFVKRAAFALLAGLALHDKQASDAQFIATLPLVESAAPDDRNFVKKGVSWALRVVGRRSRTLNAEAVATAQRLTASPDAAARWIGRGALKELTSALVQRRLDARDRPKSARATRKPAAAAARRRPRKAASTNRT